MAEQNHPLIALVSATPAAIPPAEAALRARFPDATLWNIVDDRLLQDAEANGGKPLIDRMERLLDHAVSEGADGILVTCSIYGGAIRGLADALVKPVLSADGAAFDAIITAGFRTVLVLSSAPAPLEDSLERLQHEIRAAAGAAAGMSLVGAIPPGAFEAARSDDPEHLAEVLAEEVSRHDGVDAVFLAQYSLSPATDRLAEITGLPVLAGPQRAAELLHARLQNGGLR